MAEVPAVITFALIRADGPIDPGPSVVHHTRRALTWEVREVLEEWTHPQYLIAAIPGPGECRRYRLRVCGPLPWRLGERGEFTMIARSYSGRPGWWITPA